MILNPILPLHLIIPLAIILVVASVTCLVKKKYHKVSALRRILLFAFMLVTLLRPSFVGGESNQATTNASVFFAIDNTNSMYVRDVDNNSRMSALKKDAISIIQSFAGARFSIYVQDITPYVLLPATSDSNAAIAGINSLSEKPVEDSSGSDLNNLIELVQDGIKKYGKRYPDSLNIVIFMSDGETTGGSIEAVRFNRFDATVAGAVIGYGTADGGKIPNVSKYSLDSSEYLECDSGTPCISSYNEEYLRKMTQKYSFSYTHSSGSLDDSSINNLKDSIKTTIDIDPSKKMTAYTETYWIFALVVLVLLLWEFASSFGVILSEREVNK